MAVIDTATTIPPLPEQFVGGTIEAQQMVRRVKTYTIVDSEFNSLAATTVAATVLLLIASFCLSFAVDCLITQMSISSDAHLNASQIAFFYYAPRAGFYIGSIFFALTVGAWIYGWSIFRHVKRTSREGQIISR
jgi:hypothetical protein